MMKKTFKVGYVFHVGGSIEVEARSFIEAVDIVNNMEIGHELTGSYVPNSIKFIEDGHKVVDLTEMNFDIYESITADEVSDDDFVKYVEGEGFRLHTNDEGLVEIISWTEGGVRAGFVLDFANKTSFQQLVNVVKYYDPEEEVEIYRKHKVYLDRFTMQESLDDFNEFHQRLFRTLESVLAQSIRPKVIHWLEVNRDNGFFNDEQEAVADNFNELDDDEILYYFFEWIWSEREREIDGKEVK